MHVPIQESVASIIYTIAPSVKICTALYRPVRSRKYRHSTRYASAKMLQETKLETSNRPGRHMKRATGTRKKTPSTAAAMILRCSATCSNAGIRLATNSHTVKEMARPTPAHTPVRTPESCKTRAISRLENRSLTCINGRASKGHQGTNPELRGMLRDIGCNGRSGDAFVTGAVDRGHSIPIRVVGSYRSITIRGGEQQVRRNELAPVLLLLAAIDAIA